MKEDGGGVGKYCNFFTKNIFINVSRDGEYVSTGDFSVLTSTTNEVFK